MLGTIGSKGQVVIDFFSAIFEVVMKMVSCVMWLTPIGVSSVIAGKILSIDNLAPVMIQLFWFILTVAIGVFFYQWIVMQLIYCIFVRKNPFTFYCGLMQPMLMAFATASTYVRSTIDDIPNCFSNLSLWISDSAGPLLFRSHSVA